MFGTVRFGDLEEGYQKDHDLKCNADALSTEEIYGTSKTGAPYRPENVFTTLHDAFRGPTDDMISQVIVKKSYTRLESSSFIRDHIIDQ